MCWRRANWSGCSPSPKPVSRKAARFTLARTGRLPPVAGPRQSGDDASLPAREQRRCRLMGMIAKGAMLIGVAVATGLGAAVLASGAVAAQPTGAAPPPDSDLTIPCDGLAPSAIRVVPPPLDRY